jgi:hypothetical protein
MNLRNVDGFPEMLESEIAQFYSCILQVNGGKRQRGYIENARSVAKSLAVAWGFGEGEDRSSLDYSPLIIAALVDGKVG